MFSTAVDFANLLFAALVVGGIFGFWLSFNPAGLDSSAYVTVQQQAIRTLNVKMPLLGAVTILLTIVAAVLADGDGARLALLAAATVCFVAAGLITRFLNQPINAIVIGWAASAPPAEWKQFRDGTCCGRSPGSSGCAC